MSENLRGARIALVVCALVILTFALIGSRTSWAEFPRLETCILGQSQFLAGSDASLRVITLNHVTGLPLRGAQVKAFLTPAAKEGEPQDAKATVLFKGRTDKNGTLDASFKVPDVETGTFDLTVEARALAEEDTITRSVRIVRDRQILLTTDKPLYQPGQVMHIRALALRRPTMAAMGGEDLTIEVQDGKGNKVFKKTQRTSEFGVASADFQLADEVNMGRYSVRAIIGDTKSEKKVTVERYVLPKFKVKFTPAKSFYLPNETVTGTVQADYFFGKPVTEGKVTIKAATFDFQFKDFAEVSGRTDKNGTFKFEQKLPDYFVGQPLEQGNAFVKFEVSIRDGADHEEKITQTVPVAAQPMKVIAVPESGQIVPNVENTIYLMTTYPDGSPASVEVSVYANLDQVMTDGNRRWKSEDIVPKRNWPLRSNAPLAGEIMLHTDSSGIGEFRITPKDRRLDLIIKAFPETHGTADAHLTLQGSREEDSILLRTDKPLAKVGDTVTLTCLSPSPTGTIYLDVIRDQQTLHTTSFDLRRGRGEMDLPLSADMAGSLEIHAYRLSKSGQIVRDTRRLFVDPANDLNIKISPDKKSYLPGNPAKINFDVRDPQGRGVAAALGVAIVDESVFALQEMQPGMEKIYFLLEKELMEPKFEVHGLTPSKIVCPEDDSGFTPEKQQAANVLFALAEQNPVPGGTAYSLSGNSYTEKLQKIREELSNRVKEDFKKIAKAVVDYYGKNLPNTLKAEGGIAYLAQQGFLKDDDLLDQWGNRYDFVPCGCGSYEHSLTVVSLGPDGKKDTEDDLAVGGNPKDPENARVLNMRMNPRMALGHLFGVGRDDLIFNRWEGFEEGVFIDGNVGLADVFMADVAEAAPMAIPRGELDKEAKIFKSPSVGRAATDSAPAKEEIRVRQFFPETMYFNPAVITDGKGKGSISLDVADSITTWRVSAMGSSRDGQLGSTSQGLKCFQDFFIDIDLPVALTQNDEVSIPVAVYNYLPSAQTVTLELTTEPWFELTDSATKKLDIAENDVEGVYYRIKVKEIGNHRLTVHAMGSKMSDAISRQIEVMPDGREYQTAINDRLEKTVDNTLTIPQDAIDGASNILVKVYPGIFSQVIEGMDKILQMPFGCFEQTTSTTYPNVLVLDYMKKTGQTTPEVQMKAEQYINLGYQRLVTFEVPGGGFSWFGDPPANKMLTAYGVMEFADMAKVYEVDPSLIQRTQQWLIAQREKDGSWSPDKRYIDELGYRFQNEGALLHTAWITWALVHSGYQPAELGPSLGYIKEHAAEAKDAYSAAMVANALVAAGKDDPAAAAALDRLLDMKVEEDGKVYWKANASTMTFTRGKSADVETTALATLALIKSGRHTDVVNKALTFIVQAKDPNGTWGATQATILSLKALLASVESQTQEINANVRVIVNGQQAGSFKITPENSDLMRQVDCREFVKEGDNKIRIEFDGKGSSLYQITGRYYMPWDKVRERPQDKLIAIEVDFDRTTLAKDDILTSTVKVAYNGNGTANMVMVDLGTPPGFQVMPEDFEALVSRKVIQRYTVTGRQVILYFDKLDSGKPVEFKYRMKAKFPIRARAPKSTAYLYYNPEIKDVAPPVNVVVE